MPAGDSCGSRGRLGAHGHRVGDSWSRQYLSTPNTSSSFFPPSEVTFHARTARSYVGGPGQPIPTATQSSPSPPPSPLPVLHPIPITPSAGGESTGGWAPQAETRPPGARIRASTPGLAPG